MEVRTRCISRKAPPRSRMFRKPNAMVTTSKDWFANGNWTASPATRCRTPLRPASASIALEKSSPTTWTVDNLRWITSARSPLPVARSRTQAGFQPATISAARLRQEKSHPKLSKWLARSYRRATRSNISRTISGSRARAVSSGELNHGRSLGTCDRASDATRHLPALRTFLRVPRNRENDK